MGFTKYFAIMHAVSGGHLRGRTLLDVGCGAAGCMAQAFALGMEPTGIDLYNGQAQSSHAAEILLSAYGMADDLVHRSLRHGDITKPLGDLAGAFDFSISVGMLEHIPNAADRRAAVANMVRALRPGGTMILVCGPNRWFPVDLFHYGPRFPFYHWLPIFLKRHYLARIIRPVRSDLKDVYVVPEFLSGLRVSEILDAIYDVEPTAKVVQAFPLFTSMAVTHLWLRHAVAQAIVGFVSRTLTRLRLEPVIVILAERSSD